MTCLNFENFNNATSFLSFASIKMPKKRKQSDGFGHRKKNHPVTVRSIINGIKILCEKDYKIISNNNIPAVSPEKIDEENKDDEKIFMFKKD